MASFLELKPAKTFRTCVIRGLTSYPNGHSFPVEFVRLIIGQTAVGRLPITDKLVHWFVSVQQGIGMVIQFDASCYNVISILILFMIPQMNFLSVLCPSILFSVSSD